MQQTVAFGHRANAQAIRLGIVQANPVLGFIVEQGSGARSVAEQAEHYCRHVEREHGKQPTAAGDGSNLLHIRTLRWRRANK